MFISRQDFYIRKIEEKLNIPNLKDYLYYLYIEEMKTTREIAQIVYNNPKNSPSILKWLHYFNIPTRKGSEAIKTQWIGEKGEQRKKEIENHWLQTKETRDKLREIMQTDEYKRKQSIAKMGEKNGMYNRRRENSPRWKPELTEEDRIKERSSFEYSEFIHKVMSRDYYTCKVSGKKGNIVVHHLDGYNWCKEKRTDINNGITLHDEVHKCFHHYYGYGDNTREQFEEFVVNYNNGIYDKYFKQIS